MDVITNDRLIRRNAKIGQFSSIAGLLVLAAGMYISFAKPALFSYSILALLVGFILSQIGIYFGNRWGRRPRPDELLTAALKGLDARYRLYHYTTPTGHLLVGPAGLWVFLPKYQRGTVLYERGRWRQKGGGFLYGYMKLFGQESLGRPDLEVAAEVDSVSKRLKALLPDAEIPEVKAALVFVNDKVDLQVEDAPVPGLYLKRLKEFIRKEAKGKPISTDKVKQVQQALDTGEGTVKTETAEEE